MDLPKVSMNFTQGAMEAKQTTDSVKAIYGGADWEVLSATVQHKKGDLEVSFRIEMRRASASVVFKVLIPVIAITLLSILAGTLEANDRLLVVAVDLLAGSTMLDPDFLGLPAGTEGVPFLMALVIGNMAINSILLIYSLYIDKGNFVEFWKLKDHESRCALARPLPVLRGGCPPTRLRASLHRLPRLSPPPHRLPSPPHSLLPPPPPTLSFFRPRSTQGVVQEIYERSFARFRALAVDPSIVGECDNQVKQAKEEFKVTKVGKVEGVFKRSRTSVDEDKAGRTSPSDVGTQNESGNSDVPTSDHEATERVAELMWLMPMLIGNAVHGNADDPPLPMGPMAAYDLDSADVQQDKDEAGQKVVAKAISPSYIFAYSIIALYYFAPPPVLPAAL